MLRILLFLATNIAVLFMAAIAMAVLTALGVIPPDAPYITMLIWCALFGFGGSESGASASSEVGSPAPHTVDQRYAVAASAAANILQ